MHQKSAPGGSQDEGKSNSIRERKLDRTAFVYYSRIRRHHKNLGEQSAPDGWERRTRGRQNWAVRSGSEADSFEIMRGDAAEFGFNGTRGVDAPRLSYELRSGRFQ